jgi:general secretion pathway protein A
MSASKAYEYFGLKAVPFDDRPDPRFFFPTPSHAEVLATMQYAVHAQKACTLVLGGAGSGKTLLGRLLGRSIDRKTTVLWVHGFGQPEDATDATLCPPGMLERPEAFGGRRLRESTLANWVRSSMPAGHAAVVIVDNAEGLHPQGWEDVLALLTREIRVPCALSIILLGLPSLFETIAAPTLVSLQHRIFRTCHVAALSEDDVRRYVRHRLQKAGADDPDLFAPAALDVIHRVTGGNPALINQVCDNALIDAFGDDRKAIDVSHVVSTVNAITGCVAQPRELPPERERQLLPSFATSGHDDESEASGDDHSATSETQDAPSKPPPADPHASADAAETTRSCVLDERLRALEGRLSYALSRVRAVRCGTEDLAGPRPTRQVDARTDDAPDHDDIVIEHSA